MDTSARNITSTAVTLSVRAKTANDRLLFGKPDSRLCLDKNTEELSFRPERLFGVVRWRGDEYGTQTWRIIVAQAGRPGERLTRIPSVKPGAKLLLHAFGKVRAKRALRAIDVLSDSHVLHEISPAFWRHVHLQIARNLPIERYDIDIVEALARAKSVQ